MTQWTVEVTDAAERELRSLHRDIRASFLRVVELLEEFGPAKVGMPHVRPLEGKLWEMRLRGGNGIARAIYSAGAGRKLTVVRVFAKKTRATPRKEIELALRRLSEEDR